jgi:hypothetical protein
MEVLTISCGKVMKAEKILAILGNSCVLGTSGAGWHGP